MDGAVVADEAVVVVVVVAAAFEPVGGNVVGDGVLTLGRVPTATRAATPTAKTTRTSTARRTENRGDESMCSPSGDIPVPACRAPLPDASHCEGGGEMGGERSEGKERSDGCNLSPRPSSSVGRALHL